MGARPLRRAIQRYIEDPLADEVLAHNAEPGSTVEVEKADGDAEAIDGEGEDQVKITIVKPPVREAVGVGGGAPEAPEDGEAPEGAPEGDADGSGEEGLPAEPEVLPDVPDAPPPPDGDPQG